MAMGFAALVAFLVALFQGGGPAGEIELTTRRLLLKSERADPREIPLSEIRPGTLRAGGARHTLELEAPRPIGIPGVPDARLLAASIELERWLASQGAAPPNPASEPRAQVISEPYDERSRARGPSLILTRDSSTILPCWPTSDISAYLGPILGARPRVEIELREFMAALERLDSAIARQALDALAAAMNVPVDYRRLVWRRRGSANTMGFDRNGRIWWFDPLEYRQVLGSKSLLDGWTVREAR